MRFLRVALHFEGWCVAPDEVSYPDRVWTQPTPILLVGELEELELELEELESSRLAAESDWLGRCRVPIYIMVSHVRCAKIRKRKNRMFCEVGEAFSFMSF